MVLKLDRFICIVLFLLLLPAIMSAQVQNHIVKRGDTLYGIGKKYGVSVQEIMDLNNLTSTNLSIGQVIKITAQPSDDQSNANSTSTNLNLENTDDNSSRTPSSPAIEPRQIQRSSLPADYFYIIQRGDNLFRIAKNHNVPLADLLKWNNFENADVSIYPGQRVIIKNPYQAPPQENATAHPQAANSNIELPTISTAQPDTVVIEKVYIVQPKDTLYRIARENNVSVEEIKRINALTSNDIRVGQRIYLAGSPRPSGSPTVSSIINEEELIKRDKIRDDLVMPVEGKIISEYGLRNGRPHKGIDLGAKNGTPIFAVLDGTVVYSGVQGAYGNVVVLEHPDFVMTVYAHNEKNLVAVGAKVKKGEQIAMVGATGNASGAHLHFEYRIKGKAINPRKVLPID